MPPRSRNPRTYEIEAAVVDAAIKWWKARERFYSSFENDPKAYYAAGVQYEAAIGRLDRKVVDLVQLHMNEQTIRELEAARRKQRKKR